MQIDFSVAFNRVHHPGILYKLCSVGILGSVLSLLKEFLSNRSQHVMVNGCRSKLVNVVRSAAGQCFVPVIVSPVHYGAFSILENKWLGYADDSTLMVVVLTPGIRVTVAESLIRDIGRVSEWCDLRGMKLYASKTKTMIVSRSCTMHPQSPPLTVGGTVLKEFDDLVIFGVK